MRMRMKESLDMRFEERLENSINVPFAVVFGDDHYSFPSAIKRIFRTSVRDVFHFQRLLTDDFSSETIHLRHIDLRHLHEPLSYHEHEWTRSMTAKEICRELALPSKLGPVSFLGKTAHSLFRMTPEQQARFLETTVKPLTGVPSTFRVVFVADWSAGHISTNWRVENASVGELSRTTRKLLLSPDFAHVVSPGNCRAHTYCVCDMRQGEVTWHECD